MSGVFIAFVFNFCFNNDQNNVEFGILDHDPEYHLPILVLPKDHNNAMIGEILSESTITMVFGHHA